MNKVNRRIGLVVSVAAALVGAASFAQAALIAQWNFEPGAFLSDSSGNGHDLTQVGTVGLETTDLPTGGGAGAASFSSAGYLRTTDNLNLTEYKNLTISWSMKTTTDSLGMVWEQAGFTPGGFLFDVNDGSPGASYAFLTNDGSQDIGKGVSASHGASAIWENWAVTYDLQAATQAGIITVYKNGSPTGSSLVLNPAPSSFVNDLLYLGIRPSGALNYTGLIDDVSIQGIGVPEPSTIGLLALGGLMVWRRVRGRR